MSGGSDTTTTNTGLPAWAQPFAESYMQRSQQVADRPYQPYQGQTVAQLNPYQTAGIDAQAQRAVQGSAVNGAAQSELTRTLNGDYLSSGNPYLNQTIDRAQGDVVRNSAGMEARSGSFGNSGLQQNTAQQMGDISSQIRGADYANERNRMSNAVNQAPMIANQDYVDINALQNAGGQYRNQEQANLSDQYGRFTEARDYPKDQLSTLGKGLGMNTGSTSSSTGPGSNPYAQGLGAALAAYGAYNSGGSSSSSGGGK